MKKIEICFFQISLTWLTAVMSVGFQRFQGWGEGGPVLAANSILGLGQGEGPVAWLG